MKKTVVTSLFAMFAVAVFTVHGAAAAEGAKLPSRDWSTDGIFGTFDRPSVQRGLQVYQEVCASCHSLSLVAYRNLRAVGFNEDEVKAIAAEFEVEDGPNDEGEMYMRAALPSDRFVPPFPNENAARAANAGAYPPDLSLMAKARKGGADYLYAMMMGYRDEAPEGVELAEGMYFNEFFPGTQTAMPPPISEEAVEYADGTPATAEQISHDVTAFLVWAAQPELEERKSMGRKVILFLIVLTAMLYALKRKIWSDLH